ncbi:MAG: hypothetical protein HY796_05725 [Elusimicrobia bacterium]|nr:hypothetical protein [Elusimicrobiota bacterium]
MNKANANQPATKADLNSLKSELKADINRLDDKVKGLDNTVKGLSGEVLKNSFKIDRMVDRLDTEFSTKADINRLFNLLDSIAGDVKRYQREDALHGEAVIQHTEKLSNHETRITLLEKK